LISKPSISATKQWPRKQSLVLTLKDLAFSRTV